uniref:Peptidoglycan recognition protein 5 n=1 Tax=Takifugu rubripes TaxID=31033 RepID=A0A674NIU8_TAKRU
GSHSRMFSTVDRTCLASFSVVSRAQWGAAPPKRRENLTGPAQKVVIHHTALFLVGFDGTVFEGRGWGVVGAHAKGFNNESLGIAFMGNFNNDTPSSEAVLSVRQLLHSGVSQGFLCPDFALMGHRDLSATECPGANLYAALPKLKLRP